MKPTKNTSRTWLVWLSTLLMLVSSIGTGWAQTLAAIDFDISAPVISHEPLRQGSAGQMLTITAAIEDNVAVKSAAVFFLTSTGQQYQQVDMSPDSAASIWLATVDTTVDDTLVNYYIVAEDSEGNRIQKGGQSNPFVVELSDSELSLSSSTESRDNSTADKKPNLLLLMAGVVLAGILLSGSGGGSDGGAVQSDDTCCTVTFTVDSTGGN
jgi:hypothetical protein